MSMADDDYIDTLLAEIEKLKGAVERRDAILKDSDAYVEHLENTLKHIKALSEIALAGQDY